MTFNPSKRISYSISQVSKVEEASKYFKKKIWESPDFRRDISFSCNVKVSELASLTPNQALAVITVTQDIPRKKGGYAILSYLKIIELTAAFDYPLKNKYLLRTKPTLDFKGDPMPMHIGYFLWQVAKAYKDEIYTHQSKYGVWGHSIDDLWFEAIILRKIGKHYYGIIQMGS